MKYIIYKNESYKLKENNILINYENIYGREELKNEEKQKIFDYIKENFQLYDESLNESFILLFNFLNTYPKEKETEIDAIINSENNEEKKYIRFDKKISLYFMEEGKGITTGKLLNSFLYMEKLCFGFLIKEGTIDNINNEFSQIFSQLNCKYKKLIDDYFKHYNDKIITKNDLATALRRYIIRYFSVIKDENNNLNDEPIITFLKIPDLWDNEIIKKMKGVKNFQKKIEELIDIFKNEENVPFLKARHAYEFYKIIGKEDEECIINEISQFESEIDNKDNNLDVQDDLDKLDFSLE